MKKVSGVIFIILCFLVFFTGCEHPSDSDSGDDSVYITMQYYDFQSSDINFNVVLGNSGISSYAGTYLIYSENWLDYEDGLSLHFMPPDSSGSMAEPGYQWLVLKIQKDAMTPGIYTLDSGDSSYQLSAPGQVKLWFKDLDGVKHAGAGEVVINTLNWSFSDDDSASLTVNLSLDNVSLAAGQSGSMSRAISESGSVTGSFSGQASISDDVSNDLIGTTWRGSYLYYSVTVVDYLEFVSATSCKGTTVADGQSIITNMTYTYNPSTRTGTLTADSTLPFFISGDVLTFNNVNFYKQ